jgi:hypothetical protein
MPALPELKSAPHIDWMHYKEAAQPMLKKRLTTFTKHVRVLYKDYISFFVTIFIFRYYFQ